MIRPITIVGTVALALVTSLGCDRRQDTPSSTTNTTGAGADGVRDLDKNGRNDTRLDDKGVVRNEVRNGTVPGRDVVPNTAGYKVDRPTAEAKRELADDKADFMKKRADYKASITDDLADADKRIAKLEERLTTDKDAADRARIQRALPTIRTKRAAIKRSLDSVDTSTEATWETTKDRVGHAWTELKSGIDDAAR